MFKSTQEVIDMLPEELKDAQLHNLYSYYAVFTIGKSPWSLSGSQLYVVIIHNIASGFSHGGHPMFLTDVDRRSQGILLPQESISDFNLDVARDFTTDTSEWKRAVSELKKITGQLTPLNDTCVVSKKKCECPIDVLMNQGCQCNGA